MYFKNRKALTEVLSFVLLTLIIIAASVSAYIFSKNQLYNSLSNFDLERMDSNFNQVYYNLDSIQSFDNSQVSNYFVFNYGTLEFVDNQLRYRSMVEYYNDSGFCLLNVCSISDNGYEIIYFNLTNGYSFKENLSLLPGRYALGFRNLKNESKIQIIFY